MKLLAEKLKAIRENGEFPLANVPPKGQFTEEGHESALKIIVNYGNDAMQTEEEAAEAIALALAKGWDFVKDANGNKVGKIERL